MQSAEKIYLSQISEKQLVIPFYQRGYVWGQQQLDRFLEDMECLSDNPAEFFFGILIFKPKTVSVLDISWEIVDGQQRLTTLVLFLKILCHRNNNLEEFQRIAQASASHPFISHRNSDRDCFDIILHQEELSPLSSNTKLAQAYNFLLEKIDAQKFNYTNIINNIIFVAITLDNSDDSQKIFDTINSTGQKLTTSELIKNYLFSDVRRGYYEKWKDTFEKDENTIYFWTRKLTQGRQTKEDNIEIFIQYYLHIKINEPIYNLSASQKREFRSTSDLFNQYKYFIKLTRISKIELIEDIINYAQLYKKHITDDILNQNIGTEWGVKRLAAIIFSLDGTTLIPYLLYVLKNQTNLEEITKLAKILETYLVRRIICNCKNNNYSDLFSTDLISNQIITADRLIEFLIGKDADSSLAVPDDNNLKKSIEERLWSDNKRAKAILYFLESRIRPTSSATDMKSFNRYTLEHLLPQKWQEEQWPLLRDFDKEKRKKMLRTLGNLAIIPSDLNTKISNNSWTDKKHELEHCAGGLEILRECLHCSQWNEHEILERANWLYEKARETWQFGSGHHSTAFITSSSNPTSPQDSGNGNRRAEPNRIKIILPNGHILERKDAINTLSEFITFIGIQQVAALNITVYSGKPLLSTTHFSNRYQRKIDEEYYFFKNASCNKIKNLVSEICNGIGLEGVTVDCIPKTTPIEE